MVVIMPQKSMPHVIPPRSKFKLVRSDETTPMWKNQIGKTFRIGYYSKQDGTDCIWLVNEKGEYEETTSRDHLLKYFEPLDISKETELYRHPTEPFGPLAD